MSKKKKQIQQKPNNYRITKKETNLWAFLESIINHSISKGQLVILAWFLLIALVILKLPEEDLSKIVSNTFELAYARVIFSYSLNLILVFFVVWHTRMIRRTKTEEVSRIAAEKSELQKKLIPEYVESSEVKNG